MRQLGKQDTTMANGGNSILEVKPVVEADKNDQTKQEQSDIKEITSATNKLDETTQVADRPKTGTVTEAKQVSQIPQVQSKVSPERAQQVIAKKEETDAQKIGLEPITVLGHETTIVPHRTGNYNFIVNCQCQWQGRFVTIREANQGAMDHKKARKHLDNKNK